MDLAKQIRVMVKERMVDRVREQSGRDVEQDIELTREEVVQEYLQGVQNVDCRVDEDKHMCSATAVMLKEWRGRETMGPAPIASQGDVRTWRSLVSWIIDEGP